MKDLELASWPSQTNKKVYTDPFLQHSYMCFSKLEPCVLVAIKTARKYGLFPQSTNPPHGASLNMPIFHHPAVPITTFKSLECMQTEHGLWTVADISPPQPTAVPKCRRWMKQMPLLLSRLASSRWLPSWETPPSAEDKMVVWPTGSSPYNMLRFFTNPRNMLIRLALMDKSTVVIPSFPSHAFVPPILFRPGNSLPLCPQTDRKYAVDPPQPCSDTVEIWTDSSALDNRTELCTASSRWISSLGLEKSWRLIGLPPSLCVANIWDLQIPTGLKEVLWKWSLKALPLGHWFFSISDLGMCRCSSKLSLPHLWKSYLAYDLGSLQS
jgi:hypothetical protein